MFMTLFLFKLQYKDLYHVGSKRMFTQHKDKACLLFWSSITQMVMYLWTLDDRVRTYGWQQMDVLKELEHEYGTVCARTDDCKWRMTELENKYRTVFVRTDLYSGCVKTLIKKNTGLCCKGRVKRPLNEDGPCLQLPVWMFGRRP